MAFVTSTAALALLTLLATACGMSEPAATGPTGAAVSPSDLGQYVGFDVRLATNRESYGPDETVTFTLTVCNGDQPAVTSGGGSLLPGSFVVEAADGTRVADDTHRLRTPILLEVPWQPGECREITDSWDQHFWNRPDDVASASPADTGGVPVVGGLVAAGEYRVVVSLADGPVMAEAFSLTR
jgi:hypothetical protein